jgi:50S ribosomal protein L16 3-hydroxylase
MSTRDFVQRYWQRRPCLLRAAVDTFVNPVDARGLRAMAQRDDVESRLVTRFGGAWNVQYGPFSARALPSDRRPDWTLLVQGVDLVDAAVARLARRFAFLPAARFDDVMISYATPGGGVGPHIDQYDVFLLQAQGRRRWRIARNPDPDLIAGLPLRILANFQHEEEWVLEPGDMLYLPPGVAHEGTSLDHGITISVGYRLPRMQELLETHADIAARDRPAEHRLRDRGQTVARFPGLVPDDLIDATLDGMRRALPTRRDAQRALLENLTEPKAIVQFEAPEPALTRGRFQREIERRGLSLDLKSRVLYAGAGRTADLAINAECRSMDAWFEPIPASAQDRSRIKQLADDRALAPGLRCTPALLPLLYTWYLAGWLHPGHTSA